MCAYLLFHFEPVEFGCHLFICDFKAFKYQHLCEKCEVHFSFFLGGGVVRQLNQKQEVVSSIFH